MMTITMTRKERINMEKKERLNQFLFTATSFLKGRLLKTALSLVAAVVILSSFGGVSQAADDIYTVQKGDTLTKIAQKHKVTVKQLKDRNELTSDLILVGQELVVQAIDESGNVVVDGPGLAPGEIIYKIEKGDTLTKIARKFNVSVLDIIEDNHLQSTNIIAGRVLSIQTTSDTTVKPAENVKKPSVVDSSVTYKVQAGDTLFSLAKRFETSLNTLRTLNSLKSDGIIIGQTLKIPSENTVWSKAIISGAIDNTSIEIIAHHVPVALEVTYGSSQKFENQTGKEVIVTWTKGSKNQRPALISVQEIKN